jgi:copper homeostasis protein (lipoprotein)
MNHTSFLSFLAISLISITACATEQTPPPNFNPDPAHNSRNAVDWDGTYRGVTPCADCEGIDTTLTLRQDNSFTLSVLYKGKSQKPFVTNGTFTWVQNDGAVSLKDAAGKPVGLYKVGENRLFMLDQNGKRITGALAEKYILEKQVNASLTGTYWKLTHLMGKPVAATQRAAFLTFQTEGARVTGSGGCNNIAGSYEVKPPNRLRFNQMAGTMMACFDGMDVEQQFLDVLSKVDSYYITDGRLQLLRARMAPLAEFESTQPK